MEDLKEEGSVCASKWAEHIFLKPDRFVSSFSCRSLLAVENTLQSRHLEQFCLRIVKF